MINIIKTASSIILGLMVTACSSSPSDSSQVTKNTNQVKIDASSTANIQQQLAEFQKMKPSLERLVMIEAELKSLIQEIAIIAAEQQQIEVQEVQAKKKLVVTPALNPSSPPIIKTSYSDYALQVFTTKDKDSLVKSWQRWSEKYGETLDAHHPIYQEIKSGTTSLFRVKITNFITKDNTINTCKKIKKQGDDCFLTNNTGQRL